ncbi:RatA family protein [Leminorella grimontii ATCC 33999 = DSM 5078]|nr:RatA family protein [Leminorella grimontii ATCC 33999 = DSM 5078]
MKRIENRTDMNRNNPSSVNKREGLSGAFLIVLTAAILLFCTLANASGWQALDVSTSAINGTSPVADGAEIPIYLNDKLLDSKDAVSVDFSVKPGEFSANAALDAVTLANPQDVEGDLFAVPPQVRWENSSQPDFSLVWADAATPETPLNPQPAANLSFCAQNLAGRSLVVWPQIEQSAQAAILNLFTTTGSPNSGSVPLLEQRVMVNVAAAKNEPISVKANHFDAGLNAAKVKVGESITLTVTTKDCAGNAIGNAPFVITRSDALNRQGGINNASPVHVGDTELTSSTTEYHGVTDASGSATVTVTQNDGPGVKTTLHVRPQNNGALSDSVDVIFTVKTSPDTDKATMWGHMAESASANGYTFYRPKLAAEASGADATIVDHNETWARFDWYSAKGQCDILPDIRQLGALIVAQGSHTVQESLGWPLQDNYYWSSSPGFSGYHEIVDMLNKSAESAKDSEIHLASCVDQAAPEVTPKILLTSNNFDSTLEAAKAKVGESITMKLSVIDSATGEKLPYRYFTLTIGSATNRKGETNAEWEKSPVVAAGEGLRSETSHRYEGMTDVNGEATLVFTQNEGAGVRTPITAGLREGNPNTYTTDVIFTVVTSPDTDKARMWGHMQGVVNAGNIYKRPMLADEAEHKTGLFRENDEDWATFNSLDAAVSQCGVGQVPDVSSLENLYSANASNQMEIKYGWPTEGYDYLAADNDGSNFHHVDLSNGNESGFSGGQPNYLTCSGNELITVMSVEAEGSEKRQATAKVGDNIILPLRSLNALNNQPVPNARFTVTVSQGVNRKGLVTGFDDATDGKLVIDGASYGASQASTVYSGITDEQGYARLTIAQPQGVGLRTPLKIEPLNSLITTPITYNVIFTVPTSPDSPSAQMWGHMSDVITVGSDVFSRPKLADEAPAAGVTQKENNETWARVNHDDASGRVDTGGCALNHLPRLDQLSALYSANSGNKINTEHGWPVLYGYWSSTPAGTSTWKETSLSTGSDTSAPSSATDYVSCLENENPSGAVITIETVNAGQWNEGLQAAKLQKGETLPLKVTVKDGAGNPVPGAAFTISRGDGYTRQGEKYTADSGSSVVSPVVIDGESLNDSSTKIGGLTGADGSKIINVTRPDAPGTKTAISVALYNDASVTDSIDTIFTVVTSPDSDKATMWGHMPETVTAADGTVFKRPLLMAELPEGVSKNAYKENNEDWATVDFEVIKDACGPAYVPTLDAMQSLYDAWPNGAINLQKGWPVVGKAYQTGTTDLTKSFDNRYAKSINMENGSAKTSLWNEKLYFVCQQSPHAAATQLTISSSRYKESDGFAKAKVGETIPVTITTLDAQGNPVGNTPVIFKRGDSVGRANREVNASQAAVIYINHTDGRNSGVEYYTATGPDGSVTLDISQDDGAGFETPLSASIEHYGATTEQTMPVVFTVVTSPDTPKANYWGHMADTLTSSDGLVYKRPLLASEFASAPGKSFAITNGDYDKGETWGLITVTNAWNGTNDGCGRSYLPTAANLQALYNTYPDGAMRTVNGWPVVNKGNAYVTQFWWAGDYAAPSSESAQLAYMTVNLLSGGDISTTTSTSAYYMQSCLTSPKSLAGSLMLTFDNWDEAAAAAKVKKGEKISATVTVKDSSGQPMKDLLVKISRSNALKRDGGVYSTSGADDITLSDVMPAGTASFLMDTAAKYLYALTDEQGQITFKLSQDNTAGLKTTITAETTDGSGLQDSKDAIFTVVTSPDSDKAAMWGHMPETFTNSAGVEFNRPLLRAELSSTSDTSGLSANNEIWYTWSRYPNLYFNSASPCDRLGLPTMDDLQTLYNDHPNGELATEFGLPVASGAYWGAGNSIPTDDRRGSQFQYIQLNNGATKATAANTATAQLCLTKRRNLTLTLSSTAFDAAKSAAVAKKGETIPLTIAVANDAGVPQPDITVRLGRSYSTGRASGSDTTSASSMLLTPVSPASDAITFAYTSSTDARGYWYGVTDANGKIQLELAQNDGIGLKTPLQAILSDDPPTKSDLDAIFTVITSPDSDKAQMWGHMPETVTNSAGVKFYRPMLVGEAPLTSYSYTYNNEKWPLINISGIQQEGVTACDAAHQPLMSDLQTLYSDNPNGSIETEFGWPVKSNKYWWAADRAESTGYYQYLNLNTGGKGSDSSTGSYNAQVCLVDAHALLPATIELTSSEFNESTQVAKTKKGGEIPLTVTVKDSAGNPAPNAAFTISRGDSLSRSGVVKQSDAYGGTDDITLQELTPAAGTASMTTTSVVFSGVTGADGTATFSLRQDSTMGLKTKITATLDNYPNPTSSIDTIFTVVTSPDTDKAQFWGHMPETVMSSDGVEFHRPLLAAEVQSKDGTFSSPGGNELWPLFNHNWPGLAEKTACGETYQPTQEELKTLYSDHPNGTLETLYGWPVSNASAGWWALPEPYAWMYPYVHLKTGATGTKSSTDNQALVCLVNPHPATPTSITVTSPDMDTAKNAAVAKKGETIDVVVTARDASGDPVGNAPFVLSRGASADRQGSEEKDVQLSKIGVQLGTAAVQNIVVGDVYQGVTGADGSVTLKITQDNSDGLRTLLIAQLRDNNTVWQELPVIFTVVTSPDTDKARYWGHMPETVTNGNGVKFHRPQLLAEMPSDKANYSSYVSNGETWPAIAASKVESEGIVNCSEAYRPLFEELQSLYDRYPAGALNTQFGWPVDGQDNYWWAVDADEATHFRQALNLESGQKHTTSSSSSAYRQACLVDPHASTAASITLTSTNMDTAKDAAVAKKGEALALTVTVKDSAGNPLANQAFTLSRGDSRNRAGEVVTDGSVEAENGADDLVLQELTPSSASSAMTASGNVFSGTTGADGTATFTLHQDKSLGLKTPLTAKLTNNASAQASLDATFTVLTSPDTDKALYWGHMPDTATANGKTLHRPLLVAELPSGATSPLHVLMNKETWAMAHTVDANTWDLAAQCGSLSNAPDINVLQALHSTFSSLGWPTTTSYTYLSRTTSSKYYCGYNESSGSSSCYIDAKTTAGFAACLQ